MKRNDPTFKEMVSRLQAGELTRKRAAEEYGLNLGTLMVWLGRSKVTGIPRDNAWRASNPDKVNAMNSHLIGQKLTGEAAKALYNATERVLRGEISALAAAKADPRISARTLASRVRKARLERGLPVASRAAPAAAQ